MWEVAADFNSLVLRRLVLRPSRSAALLDLASSSSLLQRNPPDGFSDMKSVT